MLVMYTFLACNDLTTLSLSLPTVLLVIFFLCGSLIPLARFQGKLFTVVTFKSSCRALITDAHL